jgi:methylated-DNA-[protein]-cysteine S-methyltransferase
MTPNPLELALRGHPTDPADDLEAALRRADREGLVDVAFTTTDSPVGPLLVAATDVGLVRLAFEGEDAEGVLGQLAKLVTPRVIERPARLDVVRRELDEYFDGSRDHFDLELDWRLSRGFRRTVLECLHHDVGYGHTISYLELATKVGNPRASRAVGTAMATNPIPIVVPCHRVLRTSGQLGGFGGGLPGKVALLELESGGQTLF